MKRINELIKKTKNILTLSEENVILRRDIVRYEAELDWDDHINSWIICIQNFPSDFSIIHELGHIYFAKKIVKCIDFAIPKTKKIEIIQDILPLLNSLVDDFINYNLNNFDELYPIYREKVFSYLNNLESFKYQIEHVNKVNILLSWFFLFYIDFNYILKEKDRQKRLLEINDFLSSLKSKIIQFTPIMDRNKLKKVSEKLDQFKTVKSTRKPIRIVSFFILVLLALDFWTKATLKRQMRLIFPGE